MHLRTLLSGIERSRWYHPIHDAYLRTVKRRYWNDHVLGLRRFYRQFVSPGSLVFDVGANVGDYSRAFLDLGARVVAVEPTPELAARLKNIRGLVVENCAVGDKPGTMQFFVSSASHMNSLVPDWTALAADNPVQTSSIEVEGTTLDRLIEKHGMPDFIKIDVEGYELPVLRGLSSCPHCLSFEFHSEAREEAIACISRFRDSKFSYFMGEEPQTLGEPVSTEAMIEIIANLPPKQYGDIFVTHR